MTIDISICPDPQSISDTLTPELTDRLECAVAAGDFAMRDAAVRIALWKASFRGFYQGVAAVGAATGCEMDFGGLTEPDPWLDIYGDRAVI